MNFEYGKIIGTPEHEQRCDTFVADVQTYARALLSTYPKLAINPSNETNELISPKDLPPSFRQNRRFINVLNIENYQKERNSPFYNKAIVTIIDWGAEDGKGVGITVLREVINQINEFADRKGGVPIHDEAEFELNDPELPNAWMAFLFVNNESKPRK